MRIASTSFVIISGDTALFPPRERVDSSVEQDDVVAMRLRSWPPPRNRSTMTSGWRSGPPAAVGTSVRQAGLLCQAPDSAPLCRRRRCESKQHDEQRGDRSNETSSTLQQPPTPSLQLPTPNLQLPTPIQLPTPNLQLQLNSATLWELGDWELRRTQPTFTLRKPTQNSKDGIRCPVCPRSGETAARSCSRKSTQVIAFRKIGSSGLSGASGQNGDDRFGAT